MQIYADYRACLISQSMSLMAYKLAFDFQHGKKVQKFVSGNWRACYEINFSGR